MNGSMARYNIPRLPIPVLMGYAVDFQEVPSMRGAVPVRAAFNRGGDFNRRSRPSGKLVPRDPARLRFRAGGGSRRVGCSPLRPRESRIRRTVWERTSDRSPRNRRTRSVRGKTRGIPGPHRPPPGGGGGVEAAASVNKTRVRCGPRVRRRRGWLNPAFIHTVLIRETLHDSSPPTRRGGVHRWTDRPPNTASRTRRPSIPRDFPSRQSRIGGSRHPGVSRGRCADVKRKITHPGPRRRRHPYGPSRAVRRGCGHPARTGTGTAPLPDDAVRMAPITDQPIVTAAIARHFRFRLIHRRGSPNSRNRRGSLPAPRRPKAGRTS